MEVRAKKALGQHFLTDQSIARAIVDALRNDPQAPRDVLEIGPGVGFVTEQLVKYAKKVIAVELDEEAIKELHEKKEKLENNKVKYEKLVAYCKENHIKGARNGFSHITLLKKIKEQTGVEYAY